MDIRTIEANPIINRFFNSDTSDLDNPKKAIIVSHLEAEKKEFKAVLGIDILNYSNYDEEFQPLIPIIFKTIVEFTFTVLITEEKYLFQYSENFIKSNQYFIDRGDGCFIIFPTPLHAFVFASYFEVSLQMYNTDHLYRNFLVEFGKSASITVRYVITYNDVYKINYSENRNPQYNYYGFGIVSNARILSKDKLNRFLIDEYSYDWFFKNFNGIENLHFITFNFLRKKIDNPNINITIPSDYEDKSNYAYSSMFPFFDTTPGIVYSRPLIFNHLNSKSGLSFVIVQRLGSISIKEKPYYVFNVYTQFRMILNRSDNSYPYSVSLGNTNPAGLVE